MAMTDDEARRLHDRATHGEELSETERLELEAWYARQDRDEDGLLAGGPPSPVFTLLQTKVDGADQQVGAVTEQTQELTTQNDTLRKEIAALQRQLASRPAVQVR